MSTAFSLLLVALLAGACSGRRCTIRIAKSEEEVGGESKVNTPS